jgi:hypothetical protein
MTIKQGNKTARDKTTTTSHVNGAPELPPEFKAAIAAVEAKLSSQFEALKSDNEQLRAKLTEARSKVVSSVNGDRLNHLLGEKSVQNLVSGLDTKDGKQASNALLTCHRETLERLMDIGSISRPPRTKTLTYGQLFLLGAGAGLASLVGIRVAHKRGERQGRQKIGDDLFNMNVGETLALPLRDGTVAKATMAEKRMDAPAVTVPATLRAI